MEPSGAIEESALLLFAIGVWQACVGGTHVGALLFLVEANAFGAALGIDDVQLLARTNGVVGTGRFTEAAVDAVVDDECRHGP